MKEMYKDNCGNWHWGYKGESLTEVSYSTSTMSWCKQMGMYCSMATINGYCQVTACMNMAEPMPICNDENATMPYETPKVNWKVDGMIPVEWIKKWAENMYGPGVYSEYVHVTERLFSDWEKENEQF